MSYDKNNYEKGDSKDTKTNITIFLILLLLFAAGVVMQVINGEGGPIGLYIIDVLLTIYLIAHYKFTKLTIILILLHIGVIVGFIFEVRALCFACSDILGLFSIGLILVGKKE